MITLFLTILLFNVSYFLVLKVLRKRYINKINTAANIEMAVNIRKKYSYIRFGVWILTLTFFITILYFSDDSDYILVSSLFSLKFIVDFPMRTILPVSVNLPKDIPQGEKFVLYLRGFSSDNYEGVGTVVDNYSFECFSEYHFINIFNKYLPVYTVGMTKELSSPLGAKRIYLDNKGWEDGVSKLINMAEMVVVLVNDSDNCIIEIEKCYNLNKTILIVDDIKKLTTVSEHFNSNPFPTSIMSQTLLFDYNPHNSYSTLVYENTENSYRKIIKQLMKERYGVSRLVLPSMLTNPFYVFIYVILTCSLFIFIIKAQSINIEVIMYLLLIAVFFVVVTIAYSQPMSKWRKIKKEAQG